MQVFVGDKESYEGKRSLYVVPGPHHVDIAHLDTGTISASAGFMLIDKSDTTKWKHSNPDGVISIRYIEISIHPTNDFEGRVQVGFLDNVNVNNASFHPLFSWDFANVNYIGITQSIDLASVPLHCDVEHYFGPITATDTTWAQSANIVGPDGAVYMVGDGDLVLKVTDSGGTSVDTDITVGYLCN